MNGILLFILSFSPLFVNAVGSPASTHPPSNIDWNTLDTLIEIPSPNVDQKSSILTKQDGQSITQPFIQTNPIQSPPPQKKTKKRNPQTIKKAYQNQQRKYHEDKEYAVKRRLQVKLANRRYKERKSPSTPPDIDFSQFEDIVDLLHSDSSPKHQDNQHENVKKEKKKYIRTKETNRRRWKTEKLKMEADDEYRKKRKAQQAEAAKRCRKKRMTVITEEEKERQRININERARKSYALARKRPGGFYGSAENKKIQMLLQKMKDGLASEEDLKIITDHRAKRNEAVKRSRDKKRKE